MVYLAYMDHFRETTDKAAKLGVFSTIPQIYPKPGRVELDPMEIWEKTMLVI